MSKNKIPLVWVNGVPRPTAEEYSARRAQLFAALPENSALVVVSAPELLRNGSDNAFDYRQSSDMLYLSGFPEANSVLVLKKTRAANGRLIQKCYLFVSRQDRASELWHGKRVGLEAAVSAFGADRAFAISTLKGNLAKLLRGVQTIYTGSGADSKLEASVAAVISAKTKIAPQSSESLVSELRLVKSPAELAIMYRSAQIAATAHARAMRSCAPDVAESDLKGEIEYVFTVTGNAPPAYGTIVAGGVNGLCLHHPAGNDRLKDGEMVLIDAGCELSGYASDITRTFPVNGRFSEAQREIYELVLASQEAAIAAVKPGVSFDDLDEVCAGVLREGLTALGFDLRKPGQSTKKGSREAAKLSLYDVFPHGLGHWLGLDVHDVGADRIAVAGSKKKAARPLVPGMVLTIEPGLYLSASDKRIPERYRGIAVRIEDDVEVRENGHFVLTHHIVKSVAAIEALMAGL